MATILTSTIINVNVSKLKKELEAPGDVKVKEIAPKDGATPTTITLTRGDGTSDLLPAQETVAQATIDSHVDLQDEDLKFLARDNTVLGNKFTGTIDIYNDGVAVWRIDASNNLLPITGSTFNIGSSGLRINQLFAVSGNFSGDLTVDGNLTVNGTLAYVNTTNLNISDNIITLNSDWTGAPTEDAGILVERGTEEDAQITWNETVDKFQAGLLSDQQNLIRQDEFDAHANSTSNPHSVTKSQVGLGNVTDDAQLKREAGDFQTFAAKTLPVSGDVFLIEDSADSSNKKYSTFGQIEAAISHANLVGVVGTTYTHTQIDTHINSSSNPHSVTKSQVGLGNVTDDAQLKREAGDFQSFSVKGTPTVNDVLIIEDVSDSDNKKYITIDTLPFTSSGSLDGFPLVGSPAAGQTIVFSESPDQWNYIEEGVAKKVVTGLGNKEFDATSIPDDAEYLRYDQTEDKIVWAPAPGVSSSGPIGSIVPFAGDTPPQGYLFCDGSAISRVFYADLFDIIGTTFGPGDGSTTFNIPDLRQRFLLGKAASGTGDTLGGTGGTIDHTHVGGAHIHDMANHTHTGGAHTHGLGNHTHGIPAHYHSLGAGADLAISASGSHVHKVGDYQSDVSSGSDATVISIGSGDTTTDTYSDGETHSHATGDFTGRIGLVTGGVDGNTTITSDVPSDNNTGSAGMVSTSVPSTNNTGSAGNVVTSSANPPYMVVNYAIKYSDNLLATGVTAIANDIAFSGIVSQQTHAAYPNSEVVRRTFGHQTTSATEDTAFTLPIPDASVVWVEVKLAARLENTGTNRSYAARIFGGVRRNGGGSAVLIDQAEIAELMDDNLSNYIVDLDVNGNDLRVRVTGAAGETVNWAGTIEYQAISLAS